MSSIDRGTSPTHEQRPGGWRQKALPALAVVCPMFLLLATPLASRWIETDIRERVNTSARLNELAPLGVTVDGRDVILGRTPSAAELAAAEEHLLSLDGVGALFVPSGAPGEPTLPISPSSTTPSTIPEAQPTSTTAVVGTPAFDVSGVTRESGAVLPLPDGAADGEMLVPSGTFDEAPDGEPEVTAVERTAADRSPGSTTAVQPTSTTVVVSTGGPTTTVPVGPVVPAVDATSSTTAPDRTTVPPTTAVAAITSPTTTTTTTTAPTTTTRPTTTTTTAAGQAQSSTPRIIIEMAPTDVLFSGKVGSYDEREAVLGAFAGGTRGDLYSASFLVEPGHAPLITGALADYLALLEQRGAYASVTVEPGLVEVVVEVETEAVAKEMASAATTLRSVGWQVDDSLEVNE